MIRTGRCFLAAGIIALAMPACAHSDISPGRGNAARFTLAPITTSEAKDLSGLGCQFTYNNDALVIVTIGIALIKPGGTAMPFKLDKDQSFALINFGGNFGNHAVRVLIDRDEQAFAVGEEGQSFHARLTVRQIGQEQTVAGTWTCGA